MRVLLIDDEPMYFKMMVKGLEQAGYELEYARTGNEGLASVPTKKPDMIIVDLKLPDISGFDIIERIRKTSDFSLTPIIVITGKSELGDKVKAFSLGADDYLVKPFDLEELIARLGTLARRGTAMKYARELEADQNKKSTLFSVHSLRGGVGSSTLAVNLGLALNQIWNKRTLILDPVTTGGQVAMMLNTSPRVTLENYADILPESLDETVAEDLAILHKSGIHYAVMSKLPIASDVFSNEFWVNLLEIFIGQNDFVVVDVPHDFSDSAIQILNASTEILLVMGPELSSLRSTANAMDIYGKLGIPYERVKIVLNMITNQSGIKQVQFEKALGFPISYIIPYDAEEVVRAINFGEPFILSNHELPISMMIEDIAYELSDESYKSIPPAIPSDAWKRVSHRNSLKKK